MRSSTLWNGMVMVMLGGSLALAGCGGSLSEKVAETVVEKGIESALSTDGQKANVDIGKDGDSFSMTIQGEDGGMQLAAGTKASIPADFPKDVPLYPGLEIIMVQTMGTEGAHMIMGSSSDSMEKVAAFYKKETAAQGWTEQMSMNQPGDTPMQMLTYEKDGRMISVTILFEENQTKINLTTADS